VEPKNRVARTVKKKEGRKRKKHKPQNPPGIQEAIKFRSRRQARRRDSGRWEKRKPWWKIVNVSHTMGTQ